jgi:hypothetical protein
MISLKYDYNNAYNFLIISLFYTVSAVTQVKEQQQGLVAAQMEALTASNLQKVQEVEAKEALAALQRRVEELAREKTVRIKIIVFEFM